MCPRRGAVFQARLLTGALQQGARYGIHNFSGRSWSRNAGGPSAAVTFESPMARLLVDDFVGPPGTTRWDGGYMRTLPAATLSLLVGMALACNTNEPTGPDVRVPAMEPRPTTPAAVVITRITAVDQVGDVGAWTSLASGLDGRQHIVYQDVGFEDLRYATCATSCGEASNWTKVRIDVIGEVGHEERPGVGRQRPTARHPLRPGQRRPEVHQLRPDRELHHDQQLENHTTRHGRRRRARERHRPRPGRPAARELFPAQGRHEQQPVRATIRRVLHRLQ